MEQMRRYVPSEQGWASQDERALPNRPRMRDDGSARRRREGGLPPAAQEPLRAIDTTLSAPDADTTAPARGGHLAALRRAIVLSEVIGPPRALRGEGGFW